MIQPIGRMVALVKQLASNPLATKLIDQESHDGKGGGKAHMETDLLEGSLRKIGALLTIGNINLMMMLKHK